MDKYEKDKLINQLEYTATKIQHISETFKEISDELRDSDSDTITNEDEIKLLQKLESSIIYFVSHIPIGELFHAFSKTVSKTGSINEWARAISATAISYMNFGFEILMLGKEMNKKPGSVVEKLGELIHNFYYNHPMKKMLRIIQKDMNNE